MKDDVDMMLFKCQQEVQVDLDRHRAFDCSLFVPAVKTTESSDQPAGHALSKMQKGFVA